METDNTQIIIFTFQLMLTVFLIIDNLKNNFINIRKI